MANIKYFSDWNGEPVELRAIQGMDNAVFAQRFPGVKGLRSDSFQKWVGKSVATGEILPMTRRIEYKRAPSLHACNTKCLNGRHNGTCECQCGGRNHGRGTTVTLARP
ncbi:hypothetical protein [Cupriavidus pauculus]|uniref:hypothetical protein n=1 Tax=Cupriavidus pauculus TaxID=82633 RepID=UPI003857E3A8